MRDDTSILMQVNVGDIFHATCPSGARRICVVEGVSETAIQGRNLPNQIRVAFDRATGIELGRDMSNGCRIDSIAPLPIEIQHVLLNLDRKQRSERDIEKAMLNEEERQAILSASSFYRAHPLHCNGCPQ